MLRTTIIAAASLLALAACNRSDDGTVSMSADGGNISGAVNRDTGEMKIDVPGFQGSVKLPKMEFDAGNFELNGVKLYPGSRIENVDVSGKDGDVRVRFSSPADPGAVQGWFQQRLGKAGFDVKANGQGLAGTTDEHKSFRLDLTPDGADHAQGTIVIGN